MTRFSNRSHKASQKRLLNTLFSELSKQPKLLQLTFFWLPTLFGLLLLIGGLKYVYEVEVARPQMAYMGVPKTQNNLQTLTHVLRNDGFMLAYSEALANPVWVTYKVTPNTVPYGKRPRFEADWRSLAYIRHSDYTGSGYNRGHMAPNYVIASRYGFAAQKETFLMTNITPQKPQFNQKIWQRLEEISADFFPKQFGDFWVVTGPIFDADPKRFQKAPIAIPKAFYKIFIRPSDDGKAPVALAFILPQTAKPKDSLLKYVTTIDAVEAQTGIDFFWQLDDAIEHSLESSQNPQAWSLSQVANLPSRY
ncbi:DNA/RNA non-specific endonuclease [Thiomicrospira sp. S5]|uniref:DNA/RNA non-specific endonuclease n=1 Tax=Thiomicrospira sp. S5 TaxID=1803865 RepID=UPI000F8F630E|nr:DNA/RNA non-specific endonuclease [Thiomicrospira sp. S5]